MDIQQNYYNHYINKLDSDIKKFRTLTEQDFKCTNITKETLQDLNNLLTNNLSRDLEDINWVMNVSDKNKDQQILNAAFESLSLLVATLGNAATLFKTLKINSPELQSLLNKEIQYINEFIGGSEGQDSLVFKIINQWKEKTQETLKEEDFVLLPDVKEVTLGLNASEADLTLASTQNSLTEKVKYNPFDSTSKYIFSPGKFYNPIPKPVSYYIVTKEVDNPTYLQDAKDILRGVKIETKLTTFKSNSDQPNGLIEVPKSFAIDMPRNCSIKINNYTLDKYNLSIENLDNAARQLYRTFGKEGAKRIMYLFNQAAVAIPLGLIVALIDNKFSRMLPNKTLAPSNDSGLVFEAHQKSNSDLVDISVKVKIKLHISDKEGFTAFLVLKRSLTIPFSELITPEDPLNQNPFPNLHDAVIVSDLIINNPAEAEELFKKF